MISTFTWAHDKEQLPEPMRESTGTPPPPVGLPIDSNIYFLLLAGLGLGIYFLGFEGKKILASYSAPSE